MARAAQNRERSMVAHPAGKAREGVYADGPWGPPATLIGGGGSIPPQYRDDQPGVAELLAKITAPPLPKFDEEVYEVMAGLADLMISKQADYGPHAINRSPGGPLNGINVRMHDKLSRVINLTATGPAITETSARYESVRDTYRDIANYAVIAVMVLDGTWPK